MFLESDVLSAELDVLKGTKLADSAVDVYKALHKTAAVPKELTDACAAVRDEIAARKAACEPLLKALEDGEKVRACARTAFTASSG